MTFTLRRQPGRFVPLLVALGIAACEFPSEPPIFEQTWVVPADSTTVSVATLLPANVAVTGGGTAFTVTTPAANINSTLGAICGQPACQNPGSATVPTPAFTSPGGALGTTINFPSGVNSLTVTGGSLQVQVTNNIGFDPLRPNGAGSAPYGSITVGITSGGVNSNTVINGSPAQGMPNGAMTTLNIPLPTGAYTSSVTVSVSITAPAGPAATIASGNTFAIAASLVSFSMSAANVVVNATPINAAPNAFDLDDIDIGDNDVIQGGGLQLEFVNPFNATAIGDIVLAAPAQGGQGPININKNISIAANATSSADLTLSSAEMQSLIGKTGVTINVTGSTTGAGPGNSVSVTPAQKIIIRTKLQLILHIGG